SWCSNRTTRFSLGLYFLGRGHSAPIPKFVKPLLHAPIRTLESKGALATVPFEREVRNPPCNFGFGTLAPVFTEHPNRASRQGLARAVTPNTKYTAAYEEQPEA